MSDAIAPPRVITGREIVLLTGILILAGLNLTVGQSQNGIKEWDEARHGVNAFEMATSGNWLVTTYGGTPDLWNLKPPLGAWLIAGGMQLGIAPEWALRIPSIICALLCIPLTMLIGCRFGSIKVGILAGAMLATCFPFICLHSGRTGDYDAQFTCAILAATYTALRPPTTATCISTGLALSAAALLKSFALLPWGFSVFLLMIINRRNAVSWLLTFVAFCAPVLLWGILRYSQDGGTFLKTMLEVDLIRRGSTPLETSGWSPFYYLGFLGDRLSPWFPVCVLGGIGAIIAWRNRSASQENTRSWLILGAAALPGIILFSTAKTHHNWYIYPAIPAILIGAAICLTAMFSRGGSWKWIAVLLIAGGLVFQEFRIVKHLPKREAISEAELFLRQCPLPTGSTVFLPAVPEPRQWERFVIQAIRGHPVRTCVDLADFKNIAHHNDVFLQRSEDFEYQVIPAN
jgi:4-amino-4-deoxy-L-arabinose transferase-like glycosyltransferase